MRIEWGPRPLRRQLDERPAFAAVFVVLFGLAAFFPFHRNPYICSFKQVTGYPCFTCGMTRSWIDHVHGHVLHGLAQSPYGSMLFFLALGFTLWTVARLALRLPSMRFRLSRAENFVVWGGALVLLGVNWVYTVLTGMA
jgi:hypothetical protein